MSADPLLQPFQLRHLQLRNRIITTAHEPAYSEDGMPKERYRAYHVERARGGVALTMSAGSALVSRDSPPAFGNLLAWKDEVVPWLRLMADEVHGAGAAIMIQLTHLGRRTRWDRGDWLPVLSASHHREAAHRAFPKQVETWDLDRIARDYADAAERMRAAGLDGIELEAYGHLLDQFWSPLTNTLPPPCGGSLEQRLTFTFRVLEAIRARVGPAFIVGIRYSCDERLPGGIDSADGLAISQRLKASGLVDFLNIVRGHIDTDAGLTDLIPIQGMASAPHLDMAGAIRAGTALPTLHAARIQDIATARHAVATGKVDLVGMTRAHLADPHLVRKLATGRAHTIRPCVGANYCLDRIYQGADAFCIHNPATGRELSLSHEITRAARACKVVVVGAGPAGLEAARVAGERGHQVVVFEATDSAGGQVRLAARSARRREMLGIIDWRVERCADAGVMFRFNTYAEAADVQAENPEIVIVATGGLPDTALPGAGSELTVSTWDIISGAIKPGRNVLLFDDAGDHPALQAAEIVAAAGSQLEVMTPDRAFAPEVMAMNLVPYLRALQRPNVRFTVTWRLTDVHAGPDGLRAVIGSDYGVPSQERMIDQVIVNHGTRPLDELYFSLQPHSCNGGAVDYERLVTGLPPERSARAGFQLFRIGDAISARNTHAAIYDAARLMQEL